VNRSRVHIPVNPPPAASVGLPLVEPNLPMGGFTINVYTACDLRCTYCITQAQGHSWPRYPRHEIAQRLREELDAFSPALRQIGVGGFCDAYPRAEEHFAVTRPVLEVLVERELKFWITTKGWSIERDLDLLAAYPSVRVLISLLSVDEQELRRVDPFAPPAERRLAMAHRLSDAGVKTNLMISPWIPGVSDVGAVVARVHDPRIKVTVTPVRISPEVACTPFGRSFTQAEVNAAYEAEYRRWVGSRPNLHWSRPPSIGGEPPKLIDNAGRHEQAMTPAQVGVPSPGR
jgi:DNA repair photolyase